MKLVREHINEIFTQDSDPIRDMGIGCDFASIKAGDVIRAKKQVYFDFNVNKRFFKIIDDFSKYYKSNVYGAIVNEVVKKEGNYLILKLAGFTHYDTALSVSKEEMLGSMFSFYFMQGTYEQWCKYFEIIKK